MARIIVGYVSGTWDLLHIGHVRRLERAKALCDILVVGVSTDEYIADYRGKLPVIPYRQRREMIESLRYVNVVLPRTSFDDTVGFDKYGINIRIICTEYAQYPELMQEMARLRKAGIKVVVLPRTPNISTTLIKEAIRENKRISDNRDNSSSGSGELRRGEETRTLSLRYNSI